MLGRDPALEAFLAPADAPVRTLVRRSLLTRLQDGLAGSRATHPDCDEFFQRERVRLNEYEPALQRASEAFSAVVFAQQSTWRGVVLVFRFYVVVFVMF